MSRFKYLDVNLCSELHVLLLSFSFHQINRINPASSSYVLCIFIFIIIYRYFNEYVRECVQRVSRRVMCDRVSVNAKLEKLRDFFLDALKINRMWIKICVGVHEYVADWSVDHSNK